MAHFWHVVAQIANLLVTTEHDSITRNALSFLRETHFASAAINDSLTRIATDTARNAGLRSDALERLAPTDAATDTLLTLTTDQDATIRDRAIRHLIKRQHRGTISRALATLTDAELRNGEVRIPETSPLDWIGDLTGSFAINDLKRLRERALTLSLWRASSLLTAALAKIDRPQAAATIRAQLPHTPLRARLRHGPKLRPPASGTSRVHYPARLGVRWRVRRRGSLGR